MSQTEIGKDISMSSFTKRDLALLLPDEVGDAASLRHTRNKEETLTYEPPKPKLDPTRKVKRYWAGQGPEQGLEDNEDDDDEESFAGLSTMTEQLSVKPPSTAESGEGAEMSVINADDSRLRRLQQARAARDQTTATGRRRRVIEAEVIAASGSEGEEEHSEREEEEYVEGDVMPETAQATSDDENEIAVRRARVRERLRERAQAQETEQDKAEAKEKSSSEYETESDDYDDEDGVGIKMHKPLFVPKMSRDTIKEAEMKMKAEEEKREKELIKKEERKVETRAIVAQSIMRQNEMKEIDVTDNGSDAGMPEDKDEVDEQLEYEAWKVREMARIKRDAQEREEIARAQAEVIRRRNLTDEERAREDEAFANSTRPKEKAQWTFLQKYYHKGVFYMDDKSLKDEKDVRLKEYDAPTGADKVNKEALPQVMQVKNFGRRGQVKWKHLVAEDTTNWDNAWFQKTDLREQMDQRLSGVGDIDTAGRRRKKPKTS